jgi:apolipoprotein N-acyltransferase
MRQLSAQEMKTDPPNKERKIKGKWVTRDYRTYNSAVLLDKGGFVQGIQHKNNLLAFGEYIPFADVWPGVYRVLQTSEFTPGTEATLLPFEGYKLGVMICLEDILPAYGRELAAQSPDVLVNLTNDAWYGKTHEPFLHFSLATMRTVETRKWLVRATNTGVSAFVDATGRIVAQTSIYDPETLVFDVPMMKGPPTLYSRIGDVCGYLSLFFTMALLGVALRKEKHKNTA